jgi:hypothetical protein
MNVRQGWAFSRLLAWIIYRVKKFLLLIPVALFGGSAPAFGGSYEDHLYEDRLRQWHADSVRQKTEEEARWKHRNDEKEKFRAEQKAKHEANQLYWTWVQLPNAPD